MAQIVQLIYDGYRDLMDNKSDPRVNNWALMSSPFPTLAICLFYAYFVKVLGPKLMENRKPLDLRRVMMCYNLFQVILSSWLFYEVSRATIGEHEGSTVERFHFIPFLFFASLWSVAGVDSTRSDVSRSITRTIPQRYAWLGDVGGITSPSSSSSRTRSSSC